MNIIDFVNVEPGSIISSLLISSELLISSPRQVKINFHAWIWFDIASSVYSGVSSRFEELNSSRTSSIKPSYIYLIDGFPVPNRLIV